MPAPIPAELQRLEDDATRKFNWKRWGPYLSERQWGTVREDYSPDGSCWDYFPHDHARSRAYRWGEDGLLGITDRECRLSFALALWNENDPILKERLFGLTNSEGNHGEDVKEEYFYLDSTPTHSYMKALYKYPQGPFPYSQLVEENRRRGKDLPEFELADTGVFNDNRYFDIQAEYAKAGCDDILIRISISNRGPDAAPLHVLPTIWFRNTWTWGCLHEGCWPKPYIDAAGPSSLVTRHATLKPMRFDIQPLAGNDPPPLLFTDNETNVQRIFKAPGPKHAKDAFDDFVIHKIQNAVNDKPTGTKAAAHFQLNIPAGKTIVLRLRLSAQSAAPAKPFGGFDALFEARIREADAFYATIIPDILSAEEKRVMRQGFAGLLWSKQYYCYIVEEWQKGDPNMPAPPAGHALSRNTDWPNLFNRDILSMPDKWEYPWYAAWDLAFHMVPFARLDPQFAKEQLILLLREWYMHPSGQIPAYEFAFSDVNPPVHAWAVWRVYKITGPRGGRDRDFLARCFQKLLINFTWWVNRKDVSGKHLFAGGFLGLDNIGIFDRSRPLPTGGTLEQADGTAWMAFYCTTMLSMALELASEDPVYEDVASKFFEHFVAIADATNTLGGGGLWDEQDGFYYDQLRADTGECTPLRLRSVVGVIPLLAVAVLEDSVLKKLPGFRKRMQWFLDNRKDLARNISYLDSQGEGRMLLAIPSRERLERVLRYVLDENEFFSDFGVRSVSRIYKEHPYIFRAAGQEFCVEYVPGDSNTSVFGGNSNWRGPVWFPINYLLVEALERYHYFFGETFKIECPIGSGKMLDLQQVADELARRLSSIFLPNSAGHRPCFGDDPRYATDPHYRELVLFNEYFHGDTGKGIGATHQTGWTALVARLLERVARKRLEA